MVTGLNEIVGARSVYVHEYSLTQRERALTRDDTRLKMLALAPNSIETRPRSHLSTQELKSIDPAKLPRPV